MSPFVNFLPIVYFRLAAPHSTVLTPATWRPKQTFMRRCCITAYEKQNTGEEHLIHADSRRLSRSQLFLRSIFRADAHAAKVAPRKMKIRFAADCADSTDSRGFSLFLSALIRPVHAIFHAKTQSRQRPHDARVGGKERFSAFLTHTTARTLSRSSSCRGCCVGLPRFGYDTIDFTSIFIT